MRILFGILSNLHRILVICIDNTRMCAHAYLFLHILIFWSSLMKDIIKDIYHCLQPKFHLTEFFLLQKSIFADFWAF